jgi:methyl-accepting chemotaxis protein
MQALDSMRADLLARRNKEQEVLAEQLRISNALDGASVCIRICDAEGRIVYLNRAIREKMRALEPELKKQIPGFSADHMIGTSIGVFYPEPEKTLAILRNLQETRRSDLRIGGRDFFVVTNPVRDASRKNVGSVGEWIDRSDELVAERAIQDIIGAARMGDFSRRIDTSGMSGFYLQAGQSINGLMETSQTGLNEVVRVLGALAKGDLTEKITNDYQGTFGQLKNDSNATVEQLSQIIGQIREASESIGTASSEIAAGNADLSQRTEEQASSLEETASSMEELTATVRQNAENAKQANQLAAGASAVAIKGGSVVGAVVGTMSSINESSKKIVDIISVIDGIAFQTNILALNAAVEAARAGEQGRGFAVVASEVRNLAQRSAAAAKEIKTLIGDSVDKVEEGTKLVDAAGKTMEEIVQAVKRVTDIMAEISAASQEQSAGIEQVNQAITQMDQVTQQNAALVEEAAAAAESMKDQAGSLKQAVSVFVTNDTKLSLAAKAMPAAARRAA